METRSIRVGKEQQEKKGDKREKDDSRRKAEMEEEGRREWNMDILDDSDGWSGDVGKGRRMIARKRRWRGKGREAVEEKK